MHPIATRLSAIRVHHMLCYAMHCCDVIRYARRRYACYAMQCVHYCTRMLCYTISSHVCYTMPCLATHVTHACHSHFGSCHGVACHKETEVDRSLSRLLCIAQGSRANNLPDSSRWAASRMVAVVTGAGEARSSVCAYAVRPHRSG